MYSAVTLGFVVAAIVLVQCQPSWVTQYKDSRAQPMSTFIEGRTSRAFLPPRYRNLFGEESSKVRGEAFAPQTISDITGKVNQQRRQLFSWQPSANADFFRR